MKWAHTLPFTPLKSAVAIIKGRMKELLPKQWPKRRITANSGVWIGQGVTRFAAWPAMAVVVQMSGSTGPRSDSLVTGAFPGRGFRLGRIPWIVCVTNNTRLCRSKGCSAGRPKSVNTMYKVPAILGAGLELDLLFQPCRAKTLNRTVLI